MKHFIVDLTYKVPLARIEESSPAHRAYIQTGIDRGLILCAGPRVPRDGGLIIARADRRETLEAFFSFDPYLSEGLADYRYVEFQPLRHSPELAPWAAGA